MRQAVVAGHLCADLISGLAGVGCIAPGALVEAGALDIQPGGCVANTGCHPAGVGIPVQRSSDGRSRAPGGWAGLARRADQRATDGRCVHPEYRSLVLRRVSGADHELLVPEWPVTAVLTTEAAAPLRASGCDRLPIYETFSDYPPWPEPGRAVRYKIMLGESGVFRHCGFRRPKSKSKAPALRL